MSARSIRLPGSLAVALLLGVWAGAAGAQPSPAPGASGAGLAAKTKKPRKGAADGQTGKAAAPVSKQVPPETLAKLRADLANPDEAPAIEAARQLGASGAVNASAPLIEALALGGHPSLSSAAVTALGKLKDPRALPILQLYAGNRNAEVRRATVEALAGFKEGEAREVLIARLGDTAPEVRSAAAKGLAAHKEARAEARLFQLVRRNDLADGVGAALGTVASPDTITRLAEHYGRVDDGLLATALGEYLKRPDAADPLRLEVVRTLGKIAGAASTTALLEYLASVPEKEDRASKVEAQKIVDQRQ